MKGSSIHIFLSLFYQEIFGQYTRSLNNCLLSFGGIAKLILNCNVKIFPHFLP